MSLVLRQQTNTTATASSSATAVLNTSIASPAKQHAPLGVILGVILGVLAILVFVLICLLRRRTAARSSQGDDAAPQSGVDASGTNDSAGAAGWLARLFALPELAVEQTPEPPAQESARERRRRLRLRRTDSGHSVKTIPAYNEDANDGELVLYKAETTSSFDVTLSADSSTDDASRDTTRRASRFSMPQTPTQREAQRDVAATARPLLQSDGAPRREGSHASRRSIIGNVRASLRRSLGGSRAFEDAEDEMMRMEGPEENDAQDIEAPSVPTEESPDYDTLYPTSSARSDEPLDPHSASPAASPERRRSTLRNIFVPRRGHAASRSAGRIGDLEAPRTAPATHRRFGSSASVLSSMSSLAPTPSRPSIGSYTLPRFIGSGMASSTSLLPDDASSSGAGTPLGRVISRPIEGSAVRSSFNLPSNARPTPEQLRFLASVESLGLYAMPVANAASSTDLPPAWDTLSVREEVASPTNSAPTTPAAASEPPRLGAPRPAPLLLPNERAARLEREASATSPTDARSPIRSPSSSTTAQAAAPVPAITVQHPEEGSASDTPTT